jgi:L-alanine-DL-glutamate epimerase-like enolase superfamily enzyme
VECAELTAAVVGRGLEALGVGFFEMPTAPENIDGYRVLADKLDIPLALDSLAGRHRALEFLRAGALHVLQPDVCRAGGITETMRIAALADAFGAVATPHVSIGSAVHFAASLQCAAAMPNFEITSTGSATTRLQRGLRLTSTPLGAESDPFPVRPASVPMSMSRRCALCHGEVLA